MREIRAAGAVPWRRRADGGVEVVVVHRPRYDDWSLPKGKADGDESDEDTALREVEEETGIKGHLGRPLATVRYESQKGPKVVRYWDLEAESGVFVPGDEVDEIRWLTVDEAVKLLSYERDREILRRLAPTL